MTITLDIRPEIEAALARQAAIAGRALEIYAAELLEEAAHLKPKSFESQAPASQSVDQVFAKVRGLLSDEEVDTLFARTQSYGRPVDLE